LTVEFYTEGVEKVAGGLNPMDIWRGINKGVEAVVAELKNLTQPVTTTEQIRQVATGKSLNSDKPLILLVSANNDVEIGTLISQAMEKVGREGVITCETGKSTENEIIVVEGMKFNQGFLSPLLTGRSGAKEVVSTKSSATPFCSHWSFCRVSCSLSFSISGPLFSPPSLLVFTRFLPLPSSPWCSSRSF
jgi:chaperonin GroEL (HSP60 family)